MKIFPHSNAKSLCNKLNILLIPYSAYEYDKRKILIKKSKYGFLVPPFHNESAYLIKHNITDVNVVISKFEVSESIAKNATYESVLEIPCLKRETQKPNELIAFSKALKSTNYNAWVHFYEDDVKFERIWNNPRKYIKILKRFKGIITPDFSLYRDMSLVMQEWNVYRSRAFGYGIQEEGCSVIPNIRYGDERTYEVACAGVPKNGTIAVGSHGCIKSRTDRSYFEKGLKYAVDRLEPKTIVVYGTAPDKIFSSYKEQGIEILQFDSDFAKSRKAVN